MSDQISEDEELHETIRAQLLTGDAFGALGLDATQCNSVREVSTHGARIFLVGPKAFKIKRPIAFAYMNFSTCDRRHRALEHELLLNKRTAPDLYHAVHAIHLGADGKFNFDGQGPIVDWALEMTGFPTDQVLDEVDNRGELTIAMVENAALALAKFHTEKAEPTPEGGGVAGIAQVIDVAEREMATAIPTIFAAADVALYLNACRSALANHAPLLEARRHMGHVRLCHGDLHLGNLVNLNGRIVPFDCIEFNDEFARIDVMYDLAFLIMDLVHRNRPAHANSALNAYLSAVPFAHQCDHMNALGAMPLFMAARAGVRAHVSARQGLSAPARAFLAAGLGHLAPKAPRLIALGGLQGTGKSTLARHLSPELGIAPGAVILRSDAIRKAMLGLSPTERLPPQFYDRETSARTYDAMMDMATSAIKSGHSVILDAVFYRAEERRRAAQICPQFKGLWLHAPDHIIRARLDARKGDASDADIAVYDRQRLMDPGPIDWQPVDMSGDAALAAASLNLDWI
jgi:aminoglycoside phosphotransferase family enzyme/predicted kinase